MQYYTFDWATGTDETEPGPRYKNFLGTLDPHGRVYRFAVTIGLNDAYLDRIDFDSASGDLRLLLLTGDLQVGYWHTELIYTGAVLENEAELKTALTARPTEIWYDEFSRRDEKLRHSFLLVPENTRKPRDRQFHIAFETFDYSQRQADGRSLSTQDDASLWK